MKKLLLVLVGISLLVSGLKAANDRYISGNELPAAASTFIKTHFNNNNISRIKMDKDWNQTEYEVYLSNGEKITFNEKGEWVEIDCKRGSVPRNILPDKINTYIQANYPNANVLEIEKKRNGYDVKLNNRLELKFDRDLNFIRIDD